MESYNNKELATIVYQNAFKMFIRRKYVDSEDETKLEEFINNKVAYFDNSKLSMYYIDGNLTNISSGSNIDEYCSKKLDYHKFIFVSNFSKKVYKQIKTNYKKVEIFFIHEFLEDIPSKDIIPEHILLTDEEKEQLTQTYKLNELSKIFNTDMMSRYFGAKVDDVFRIKRYNINSGISTAYRVVVKGPSDIMFY
jgi:DNA-directed RNA polymerase subunit H (RpoH/RPB5)